MDNYYFIVNYSTFVHSFVIMECDDDISLLGELTDSQLEELNANGVTKIGESDDGYHILGYDFNVISNNGAVRDNALANMKNWIVKDKLKKFVG